MEPRPPTLRADSLLTEAPGKPGAGVAKDGRANAAVRPLGMHMCVFGGKLGDTTGSST